MTGLSWVHTSGILSVPTEKVVMKNSEELINLERFGQVIHWKPTF